MASKYAEHLESFKEIDKKYQVQFSFLFFSSSLFSPFFSHVIFFSFFHINCFGSYTCDMLNLNRILLMTYLRTVE